MQNFLHERKIHYILLTTSVWWLKSLLANFPMVWKWCPEILFLNLNLTALRSQGNLFNNLVYNFKWLMFWQQGSTATILWPTTFRAYIVRGMIKPYTVLHPWVVRKSDLMVSKVLCRIVNQSKQVRSWKQLVCVFFSMFLKCTPNFTFLAKFFLIFKHSWEGLKVEYMSVWLNICF